ncbi:MAG: hypothetical protein ACOCP8_01935 [archaeon]
MKLTDYVKIYHIENTYDCIIVVLQIIPDKIKKNFDDLIEDDVITININQKQFNYLKKKFNDNYEKKSKIGKSGIRYYTITYFKDINNENLIEEIEAFSIANTLANKKNVTGGGIEYINLDFSIKGSDY